MTVKYPSLIQSLYQVKVFLTSRLIKPIKFCGCLFFPIPGDHIFEAINKGHGFENSEIKFIQKFLLPGQVFWDIGANFGLYTLLAARKLGKTGSVLAIEPEPKNHLYLRINLLINFQWNVKTLPVALGAKQETEVEFLSCSQGAYSGLKVASVPGAVKKIKVQQTTLDALAAELKWPSVDFIKMDVEGAEILVLMGGIEFFSNFPRPILMCEFSDRRTVAFSYRAEQIYTWLLERNYKWFSLGKEGLLNPQIPENTYDYTNLIACPIEKLDDLTHWLNY